MIGAGRTFLLFVAPLAAGLLEAAALSAHQDTLGGFWLAVVLLLVAGQVSHVIAFGLMVSCTRELLTRPTLRANR